MEVMQTVKFRGYHEVDGLPFRRGQSVVVPSSTEVDSTDPKRRKFKTRRRQTVRVDHVGCGRSFCIGHVYGDSQRVGSLMDRGDIDILQDRYGTSDLDALVHHRDVVVKGRDIFIPIDNPTIVWAGSGGYWCEVDLNDLLEANGIRPTPVLEKCPYCGEDRTPLPDGTTLECVKCGRDGCDSCMPGGRGVACPDCEEKEP